MGRGRWSGEPATGSRRITRLPASLPLSGDTRWAAIDQQQLHTRHRSRDAKGLPTAFAPGRCAFGVPHIAYDCDSISDTRVAATGAPDGHDSMFACATEARPCELRRAASLQKQRWSLAG